MKIELSCGTKYWMNYEEWKTEQEFMKRKELELAEYARNGFKNKINNNMNMNEFGSETKTLIVGEKGYNDLKESSNEPKFNPENQSEFDIMSAKYIDTKTPYTFAKSALVKPLDVKKVKVMEEEPIDTGKKDKDTGAIVYEGTRMVEKEIDSPFIEGIIISMPTHKEFSGGFDYTIGQHIIYPKNKSMEFHLLNDTVLLNPYDIVATVKPQFVKALSKEEKETLEDRNKKANLSKLNKKK